MLNTGVLAVEHDGMSFRLSQVMGYSIAVLNVIFLVEMVLKVLAYGPLGYASDAVNVFDGIVALFSIYEMATVRRSGPQVLT